jgi:hypothetical protein
MRKIKAYIILMLFFCFVCQAQELSIKPYFSYHQSVSTQQEPAFYHIEVPSGMGNNRVFYATSASEDFTLATGLEYGLAIDYTLRNQLGFGLVLGYFSNIGGSFAPENALFETTHWSYSSVAVRPLFGYTVRNGKSTFIGKIGPVIHYSSATMSFSTLSTCTFADKLNLGYLIGLEYNYQLFKHLSIVLELGYEQYKYTPSKATTNSFKNNEIIYLNEIITNEITDRPHNPTQNSIHNLFSQDKRLKESILFNNIHLGIGIKYNIWRK